MGLEFVAKLVDEISGPASKMGVSVDGLKDHLTEAGGAMGTLGAVGVGVAAVGIAAIGAGLYEGAKMAIEASENLEKMKKSLEALSGGRASGDEIVAMLRDVEKEVPQSEAQVSKWAHSLMAAGQTDMGKLREELKAVASSEAMIEGGGEKVTATLAKLHEAALKGSKIKFSTSMLVGTGVTEEEFTQAMGMTPKQIELAKKQGVLSADAMASALTSVLAKKGAPALEGQMAEVGTIMTKAKDNISKLFEGVDISPFTKGLGMIAGLFDQSTASGKTFKLLTTTAFNVLFAIVGKVFPYIRWGMLQLAILALKAYIAIVPLVEKFKLFWAQHALGDKLMVVLKGIGWALGAVAVVIGVVIAAGAAFAIATGAMALAITGGLAAALGWVIKLAVEGAAALAGWVSGAADTAKDFVMGLVNGIKNGAGFVIDAVKGLGSSMMKGIKGVLGISSPSIEMMKIGGNMSTGLEMGLDRTAAKPQAAAEAMAAPPTPAAATSSSRSSSSTTFAPVVHVSGGGNAAEIAAMVKAALADAFEQFALTQGA